MTLFDLTTSAQAGGIYESEVLSGYPSRALREDEFHARIARNTKLSHAFEISYANIPTRVQTPGEEDSVKIKSWPLILPSTIVFGLQTMLKPRFSLSTVEPCTCSASYLGYEDELTLVGASLWAIVV